MQTTYRFNEKDIKTAIAEYCINHFNVKVISPDNVCIHSEMTGLYEDIPYYYAEAETEEESK